MYSVPNAFAFIDIKVSIRRYSLLYIHLYIHNYSEHNCNFTKKCHTDGEKIRCYTVVCKGVSLFVKLLIFCICFCLLKNFHCRFRSLSVLHFIWLSYLNVKHVNHNNSYICLLIVEPCRNAGLVLKKSFAGSLKEHLHLVRRSLCQPIKTSKCLHLGLLLSNCP